MNQPSASPDSKRSETLDAVERIVKYLEIAGKLNGVVVSLFGVSLAALFVKFLFFLALPSFPWCLPYLGVSCEPE